MPRITQHRSLEHVEHPPPTAAQAECSSSAGASHGSQGRFPISQFPHGSMPSQAGTAGGGSLGGLTDTRFTRVSLASGCQTPERVGEREMHGGGVKPQWSGGGSCWNNSAGLGKMRCEIPGYAGCNEPRLFVGLMLAARGGRRKAMLHLCTPSLGLGVSGSAGGCARGWLRREPCRGAVAVGCSPREASPAQPWVLSHAEPRQALRGLSQGHRGVSSDGCILKIQRYFP